MAPDDEGGRDVIIPLALYKRVVVVSTLIAIGSVVAGFLVLDAATRRARAPASEVDVPLALVGLGLIALGGVVYAYAARFRTPGMGTAKDGEDKPPDDG